MTFYYYYYCSVLKLQNWSLFEVYTPEVYVKFHGSFRNETSAKTPTLKLQNAGGPAFFPFFPGPACGHFSCQQRATVVAPLMPLPWMYFQTKPWWLKTASHGPHGHSNPPKGPRRPCETSSAVWNFNWNFHLKPEVSPLKLQGNRQTWNFRTLIKIKINTRIIRRTTVSCSSPLRSAFPLHLLCCACSLPCPWFPISPGARVSYGR